MPDRRITIAQDGENWYEISYEHLQEMLADPAAECWVDISPKDAVCHVTLSMIRLAEAQAEGFASSFERAVQGHVSDSEPAMLFGLPIINGDTGVPMKVGDFKDRKMAPERN